jgi:uncharacterized protein (TIGR02145 family)
MKKSILLFLLLSLSAASAFSQTGSITNISVAQRADNSGLVDVYFTLSGTALAYNITLEASLNAGGTYAAVPPANISGDLNNINPGAGKHIVWNLLAGYPNTYSAQSKLKIIATETGTGQPCPGMPYFTDARDGKVYGTLQLGTQCWMKQNLNIGTRIAGAGNQTNNGIIEKYCYNNNESNCDYYGGLYQWNEMMQYTTTPGVKGICPTGWHIPTDAEWTTLTTYVSSQPAYKCNNNPTYNAKALAATTNWNTNYGTCAVGNNLAANNATGFTGLPGGYRSSNGSFNYLGSIGTWWSSTVYSSSAWNRSMYYNSGGVNRYNGSQSNGFSVRCVRD